MPTDIFTSNQPSPYQSNMSVDPNMSIAPKPINISTVKPSTPVDMSKLPVNPVDKTNINAHSDALQAQIKQIQGEIDNAKSQGATDTTQLDEKGNPIADTPAPSVWDSIATKQKDVQTQESQLTSDLASQTNEIYTKWGLTPENFQKITDLSTKISSYQKQLADMETQKNQEISDAQNRAGSDSSFASGEVNKITRDYAIKEAGVAAETSIASSLAAALQGNWDTANKMASEYVTNATAQEKQKVDDLNNGLQQYSDLIKNISANELAVIKTQNTQLNQDLNRAQRQAQNDILDQIRQQNANTAAARLNLGQSIKFTNAQKLQIASSGLGMDNINQIEAYLRAGNSIDTITGLTDLQKQILQNVMGGTQSKVADANTMASDLAQIQQTKGTSDSWTQAQWDENLNSFVQQYPANATLAKQQFTDNFPKPAAPKTWSVMGGIQAGFSFLKGLSPL
jgi:hypothetical protein